MIVKDLPAPDLRERLSDPGIRLRTGPFVVRIGTSIPELVDPLHLLYSSYAIDDDDGVTDFSVRLDPPSPPRQWKAPQAVCYIDGERKFKPFDRRHALPMLEWILNWCLFHRPSRYLMLHCAVVESEGRAALLSGRPGVGKSTLCAGLVLRGWRLMSDEVALVVPGTTSVMAVPRPIGLKERSIDLIRAFSPDAVIGPSCPDTQKGTVAHLCPPADSVSRADEPARPAWIILPQYKPNEKAKLTPVLRAPVALRLAKQAFNYTALGLAGFEALGDVVDACACYSLSYGDLGEAVDLVNELVRQPDKHPVEPAVPFLP